MNRRRSTAAAADWAAMLQIGRWWMAPAGRRPPGRLLDRGTEVGLGRCRGWSTPARCHGAPSAGQPDRGGDRNDSGSRLLRVCAGALAQAGTVLLRVSLRRAVLRIASRQCGIRSGADLRDTHGLGGPDDLDGGKTDTCQDEQGDEAPPGSHRSARQQGLIRRRSRAHRSGGRRTRPGRHRLESRQRATGDRPRARPPDGSTRSGPAAPG